MIAKALEVRDRLTFILVLAVQMIHETGFNQKWEEKEFSDEQLYLLAGCGYPIEAPFSVLLTKLAGEGRATTDPYDWGDRTFQTAHLYIVEKFDELSDGDVVDVEFILGETSEPKRSERETSPL